MMCAVLIVLSMNEAKNTSKNKTDIDMWEISVWNSSEDIEPNDINIDGLDKPHNINFIKN